MPAGLQRDGRGVFAAREAYEDEKKAETEKLLAAFYYARRKRVARGFTVEHRKMPRGWHHVLAARDPVTGRSLLLRGAKLLLDELYKEAELVPAESGARRVFGKTQSFYSMVLGFSQKRGRNGEPNGARTIRRYLEQLACLNIVRKSGRCWYDGPGKHPRLVLWIRPFEEWTLTRFAEAVTTLPPSENGVVAAPAVEKNDRIARSGCFTDTIEINSEVCGGMGGAGGKEAPAAPSIDSLPDETRKERPSAASSVSERPTAAASEGESANSAPTATGTLDAAAALLFGVTALRVFRGAELGAVIEHIAKTHPRPLDATEGRVLRLPSPAASSSTDATLAPPRAVPRERPHQALECPGGPQGVGCVACNEWVAAVMAAPKNATAMRAKAPPPPLQQRSPWAEARGSAPPRAHLELVEPAQVETLVAGAVGRAALPTLQEALSRSVRWERTSCYASEGYRCKPGRRLPCQRCVDVDFPFRAVVDGVQWKLRYGGKLAPFALIVDGHELGKVDQSWPAQWRSFGAMTTSIQAADEDGDHDE